MAVQEIHVKIEASNNENVAEFAHLLCYSVT